MWRSRQARQWDTVEGQQETLPNHALSGTALPASETPVSLTIQVSAQADPVDFVSSFLLLQLNTFNKDTRLIS
jgi:hypothetical protein